MKRKREREREVKSINKHKDNNKVSMASHKSKSNQVALGSNNQPSSKKEPQETTLHKKKMQF